MATIRDISREAGVSEAVVSVVLNNAKGKTKASEATAERIKDIARRLNYRPNQIARQLTGKKSGIIGVVMDSCASQTYYDRLSVLEIHAANAGYRLMIGQAHNDIQKIKDYADFFAAHGVDGVICMAHGYPVDKKQHSDGIAKFFKKHCKTVFFEKPEGIPDSCSVTIDLAYNFKEAVKHLAKSGRKKIAFFKLSGRYTAHAMSIAESGYRKGLEECNLKYDTALIKAVDFEHMTLPERITGKVHELIADGTDAIVATSDLTAASVLKCLAEYKIQVPEDVAVTGCDNLDIAKLVTPSLTTFEQHNDQVAKKLFELLVDVIEDRHISPEDRHIIIQPTMVKRESA